MLDREYQVSTEIHTFRTAYLTNVGSKRFDMKAVGRVSPNCIIIHQGQMFSDSPPNKISVMYDQAVAVLKNFDPSQDVLLLGGDPVSIAICCAHLGAAFDDEFMIGKYDREVPGYYFMKI